MPYWHGALNPEAKTRVRGKRMAVAVRVPLRTVARPYAASGFPPSRRRIVAVLLLLETVGGRLRVNAAAPWRRGSRVLVAEASARHPV